MTPVQTPIAESSPAAPPSSTLFVPDGPGRAEFMKTGIMPEPKPKADPTPARESPASASPDGKTAPASEPGDRQERKSNADTRLNELLDDIREAGLTPKALKSFRNDYQRTQAEAVKVAPEKTVNPTADPKAPVKPKQDDFEGKPWAEYEAAKDKYFEDLTDYKAAKAVESDRERQRQETQTAELNGKLAEAQKRYGDTAKDTISTTANAVFEDSKIPGVVKALVNDSPVLVDLLYVLGSKPEDLEDFVSTARSNPSAAVRKLVLIEKLVMEELAKGAPAAETERGEDGKFKAPEKKLTAAPPPPKEVGGKGAPPPDDAETAFNRGDARAFIEAENRREFARRKGR